VSEPDELLGILRLAVHNHLVVYVGTRGTPGASEKTDLRLRVDPWPAETLLRCMCRGPKRLPTW